MLKKLAYLFIPLLLVLGGCATIPVTVSIEPRAPLEAPKEIATTKIPYKADIDVDENEISSDREYFPGFPLDMEIKYEFHTGKYLKDAVAKYVYPYFDPNADKSIGLKIYTRGINTSEEFRKN